MILQEVTIVTLEQTGKEYFKSDNVFDAEGLKIITDITSEAKRKVHDTEKRTSIAIRQKELDTQLELLEIERQEAFAKAGQDKDVSNEQALQVGAKQRYVLDQKLAVEQKEIENEQFLEQRRTERDISVIEEARKRELSEIEKTRIIEEQRRDREIVLIAKAKEEELATIQKKLALEKAEKDRNIDLLEKSNQEDLAQIKHDLSLDEARKNKEVELISYERERQEAEIQRQTVIAAKEDEALEDRNKSSESVRLSTEFTKLQTRLALLNLEKRRCLCDRGPRKGSCL